MTTYIQTYHSAIERFDVCEWLKSLESDAYYIAVKFSDSISIGFHNEEDAMLFMLRFGIKNQLNEINDI